MGAQLGGGGRRGSKAGLRALPEWQGAMRNSASEAVYRSLGNPDITPDGVESNSSCTRNSFRRHGPTTVQRRPEFHTYGSCGDAGFEAGIGGDGGQGRGDASPRLSGA